MVEDVGAFGDGNGRSVRWGRVISWGLGARKGVGSREDLISANM